jgi:hypothetical protein
MTDPTILDKRPKVPSILTIYRPVEEYWGSFRPVNDHGPDPGLVLDPFDALLIHLVLELAPGFPILVDLAAESTAGASSVIGLTHPHVRRVVAVARGGSLAADRAVSALRGYVRGRTPGLAPLDVFPLEEMVASLADQAQVVILADARGGDAADLADNIRPWLDELPDALVLLLGLGRVGECPAIELLLRACPHDSGRQFRLFRELGEVLAVSQLGMVARHDHAHAGEILQRLQLLYDGNFHFLDLLKSANLAAMQATQVDAEVMKIHPLSRPLRAEVDALRRAAQESSEQAEAANNALAVLTAERDQLRGLVQELTGQTVTALSFPTIVRRKLALGIVGRLYRASKRFARKVLSSMP